MSSRGPRVPTQRRNTRSTRSRRNVLDVDLNALPNEAVPGGGQGVPGGEHGGSTQPTPIDVEAFDDEVFISSPRAFAEAQKNSRRNRGNPVVVDLDSETAVTRHHKRMKRTSGQTSINELYINLEGSSNIVIVDQPPAPPRETTFTCPVCLGQLVDATSTKCGHIFCNGCLKTALAVQSRCPTCRKRSVLKDTIRIYFPSTN